MAKIKSKDSGQEQPSRKLKMSTSSFSAPLKIIVGEDKVEFYVPKLLICAESDFFKAACNEHWESGRTNTVILEEEDPKTFALFLTWLMMGDVTYSSEYVETTDCASQHDRAHLTKHTKQKQQLQDCYFLGEYLMSTGFKNGTMDAFLSMLKTMSCVHNKTPRFFANDITLFYAQTSRNSTLRLLLRDLALSLPSEDFDEMIMSRSAEIELVQDVAKQLHLQMKDAAGNKKSQLPWDKDFCHYHEHPGAAEGYSCSR